MNNQKGAFQLLAVLFAFAGLPLKAGEITCEQYVHMAARLADETANARWTMSPKP